MDYQTNPNDLPTISKEEALAKLNLYLKEESRSLQTWQLSYTAWSEWFGSTAGPFEGLGGTTMSTFTVEAWFHYGLALIFCQGKVVKITKTFRQMTQWK